MKKKFCFITLILLFILAFAATSFANTPLENNELTLEKFIKLQEQGVIGEDVSYENIKKINKESKEMQRILEKNDDFKSISLRSSTTLKKGDILITDDTSLFFVGHSAIALSSNEILHIQGIGYTPKVVSRSWFEDKYSDGWIRTYRLNDSGIASDAADWAEDTYKNSNVKYKITSSLTTTNETYCSKLVFQGYYFGGSTQVVSPRFTLSGVLSPYLLPSTLDGGIYGCNKIGEL